MLVGALRVFPRTVLPRHRPKSSMRQTGADSPAPSQTVHWTACVPLWRGRGFESRHSVKNKKLFHQTVKELFVVGVTGFEPTASWSRTKRATNCATPRQPVYYTFFRSECQDAFCSAGTHFAVRVHCFPVWVCIIWQKSEKNSTLPIGLAKKAHIRYNDI